MKIQRSDIVQNKVKAAVLPKKDDLEPKDKVILGTGEKTPDFLKLKLTVPENMMIASLAEQKPESRSEMAKGGYFKLVPGEYEIDGSLGGSLYPDSYGKIKHLTFQFGNKEFEKDMPAKSREAVLGVYRTLFTRMSEDTKFTIVTPNDESAKICEKLVSECGMENPERVKIINPRVPHGFSIWIRDSMIPVQGEKGEKKIIIQDRTYWPGEDDAMVPEAIDQGYDDIQSVKNPLLRIDGGNVLSNKEYAFIGIDSKTQTTDLLKELSLEPENKKNIIHFYETKSGKEVIEEGKPEKPSQVGLEEMWNDVAPMIFETEFKRKVYIIGNDDPSTPAIVETQPAFHIDMCTTPIGEDTFLVGDPGMAIRELKKLSPEEKQRLNIKVAKEAGLPEDADTIGKIIEVNSGEEFQRNFDNVEKELQEKGYKTERMPYLSGLRTTWSLPYITYNNCIQENYTDDKGKQVKKVYLPQFGLDPLDQIGREKYEKYGYEIVPLSMAAITILEGAIRCSAYPVERSGEWGENS